jgi:hypothetical protein
LLRGCWADCDGWGWKFHGRQMRSVPSTERVLRVLIAEVAWFRRCRPRCAQIFCNCPDGRWHGPAEATMAWCWCDTVVDTRVSSGTLHANAAWTAPRGKAPPQSMSQAHSSPPENTRRSLHVQHKAVCFDGLRLVGLWLTARARRFFGLRSCQGRQTCYPQLRGRLAVVSKFSRRSDKNSGSRCAQRLRRDDVAVDRANDGGL